MIDNKDSKMEVLSLSTSYPISHESVSGIFVKQLNDQLSKRSYLNVVTPDDDRLETSAIDSSVSKFRYAPKAFQKLAHKPGGIPAQLGQNKLYFVLVPLFLLSFFSAIFRWSRHKRIVHANWAISGAMASLVKAFRSFKLVTTLRGEDVKKELSFPTSLFLYMAVKYSDRVVVVSDDMLTLLVSKYPKLKNKISVINNGVKDAFLVGNCAAENPIDEQGGLRIVFTGSLISRKNVTCILRALVLLHRKDIPFSLCVIGDGAQRESLVNYVLEHGIEDKVKFLGMLAHERVIEHVASSHIYVSASTHEGRPNSVIEAMAAGACCVLSDINGHRELLRDNEGLLFKSSDAQQLSEILISLWQKPEKIRHSGQLARDFIKSSQLTWDGCADKYLSLFQQCLDNE